MNTLRNFTVALMMMTVSLTANAQPMSVYSMRNNARFLTDRMAHTLGLSAAILDDLYCINYDYICGVNDYLDQVALGYRYDDYMTVVFARDYALRRLLSERQWALLMSYDYFYRPITFADHRWHFSIYAHDHRMDHFFFNPPRRFNEYRGGAFFVGMRAPEPGRGDAMGRGNFRRNDGRANNGTGFRIGDSNRFDGSKNARGDERQGEAGMRNQDNRGNNGNQVGNANRVNQDANANRVNRGGNGNANGGVTVNTRNNTVNTRSSSTRSSSTAAQRSTQVQQRNGNSSMNRSAGTSRAVSNGRR